MRLGGGVGKHVTARSGVEVRLGARRAITSSIVAACVTLIARSGFGGQYR